MSQMEKDKTHSRGFRIALIGVVIGCAGVALAFLDPATGDGGSVGALFKLGFAIAVIGMLIAAFGSVIHFAMLGEKENRKNQSGSN